MNRPANIPVDTDAERALIASILLGCGTSPGIFPEVQAAVDDSAFVDEGCRAIFLAMRRLHSLGSPPGDIPLLVGALKDAGDYDVDAGADAGGLLYLYRLLPYAANWKFYLGRVVEMVRRRRALHRSDQLRQAAAGRANPNEMPPAIRRAFDHAVEHRVKVLRRRAVR